MKCSIDNVGMKCWGRAIHTLAMIGDNDIHFQFSESSLTLSTFDTSLSVCATVNFNKNFFSSYECINPSDDDDEKLTCRVPSKCILKPFRSMRFLTKGITMCEIVYESTSDCMEIILTCRFGSRINYSIYLTSEAESLQVDYDLSSLTNTITAEAKLILGSLSNFTSNKGAGDLTLKATGSKLFFKNCITDLVKREGKVYTELSLNPVDFREFSIQEDGELTFPLREFKTFASFAETMKLPVSIYFQNSAEPVVITLKSDDFSYEANLTLATKTIDKTRQVDAGGFPSSGTSGTISHVSSQISVDPNPNPILNNSRNTETHKRRVIRRPPSPSPPPPEDEFDFGHIAQDIQQEMDQREPEPPVDASVHVRRGNENNVTLEPAAKKMKALFPNIRGRFDPTTDIPGHNVVLIGESDSESE